MPGCLHLYIYSSSQSPWRELAPRTEQPRHTRGEPMADFATSRHRLRLRISALDLAEKHKLANDRAVLMLHKYGATRMDAQSDGSSTYAGTELAEGEAGASNRASLPEPLTVEEELLILRFYEQKIQQVCAAFRFPTKIQAAAIIYFKRFYLQWSVMEHDPKHIMLTCIYVACKAEESHVSAEELGKGIKQDPQVVLKNEMVVLLGLDFELIVYGPYRSLEGFCYELESFLRRTDISPASKVQELKDAAVHIANSLMITDVPLLYTPGQIALSALRRANQDVGSKVDINRFFKYICDRQRNHSLAELTQALDSVDDVVRSTRQPIEEDVRRIDRKLKYCRNPELQDGNKKRDRKSKQKPKRPLQDPQTDSSADGVPGDIAKKQRTESGVPQ